MKKKILSLVLAATISLSTFIPNIALADTKELDVTRISGKDRYDTSIEASKKTFDSSKYAVIASGEDFPDALVGGTLASQVEAPIFLVNKNSLSKDIFKEMKRIGVEHVFILGGTSTISSTVENNIKRVGYTVERLAGKNRVETATIIGEKRLALMGDHKQGMLPAAVNGLYFADALSAAPLVGQMFSDKDTPLTYLAPYMPYMIKPGFSMVFGGTSSVPAGIEEYRYAGSDRYETAIKVADAYPVHLNKEIETIILVDGTEFPDALSSAPVASVNNGAILLTNPTNFTKVTKEYINDNDNIRKVIIVGGNNSVSENIEKELKSEKTVTPVIPNQNNKPNSSNAWEVDGKWKLTIDSVKSTTERNEFADTNPEEVIIIKYSYENIGYKDNIQDLFLTPTKVIDAKGEMASLYPANITVYPQETPIGAKMIGAEEGFGLNNISDTVTIIFEYFDENYNLHKFTCKCPVTK